MLAQRQSKSCAGWLLFMVFAGVGLIALPVDCIKAFIGRPRSTITRSEFLKRAQLLGQRAKQIKAWSPCWTFPSSFWYLPLLMIFSRFIHAHATPVSKTKLLHHLGKMGEIVLISCGKHACMPHQETRWFYPWQGTIAKACDMSMWNIYRNSNVGLGWEAEERKTQHGRWSEMEEQLQQAQHPAAGAWRWSQCLGNGFPSGEPSAGTRDEMSLLRVFLIIGCWGLNNFGWRIQDISRQVFISLRMTQMLDVCCSNFCWLQHAFKINAKARNLHQSENVMDPSLALQGSDPGYMWAMTVLGFWLKLAIGILGACLTTLWLLQVLLYIFIHPPISPFLNELFVRLDNIFPLFGTFAFALFCFYLIGKPAIIFHGEWLVFKSKRNVVACTTFLWQEYDESDDTILWFSMRIKQLCPPALCHLRHLCLFWFLMCASLSTPSLH